MKSKPSQLSKLSQPLDSVHKSLLYLTEYEQPDEQCYYHETDAVSKTSRIKTTYS